MIIVAILWGLREYNNLDGILYGLGEFDYIADNVNFASILALILRG